MLHDQLFYCLHLLFLFVEIVPWCCLPPYTSKKCKRFLTQNHMYKIDLVVHKNVETAYVAQHVMNDDAKFEIVLVKNMRIY